MNLWAVVEYVTKYATKAPEGSRALGEVLRSAMDEVSKYSVEGEGVDLMRRSLQKFYARCLGERSYGVFEAVHLGLGLPLVVPMMDVVSLNTWGTRALKTAQQLAEDPGEDVALTWDSKVDKFDKRLAMVRTCFRRESQGATGVGGENEGFGFV